MEGIGVNNMTFYEIIEKSLDEIGIKPEELDTQVTIDGCIKEIKFLDVLDLKGTNLIFMTGLRSVFENNHSKEQVKEAYEDFISINILKGETLWRI